LQFLAWLVGFLLSGLYPASPFARANVSLMALTSLVEVWGAGRVVDGLPFGLPIDPKVYANWPFVGGLFLPFELPNDPKMCTGCLVWAVD
jgi:hypothetical protein